MKRLLTAAAIVVIGVAVLHFSGWQPPNTPLPDSPYRNTRYEADGVQNELQRYQEEYQAALDSLARLDTSSADEQRRNSRLDGELR
jgi:hypothetical protein